MHGYGLITVLHSNLTGSTNRTREAAVLLLIGYWTTEGTLVYWEFGKRITADPVAHRLELESHMLCSHHHYPTSLHLLAGILQK